MANGALIRRGPYNLAVSVCVQLIPAVSELVRVHHKTEMTRLALAEQEVVAQSVSGKIEAATKARKGMGGNVVDGERVTDAICDLISNTYAH